MPRFFSVFFVIVTLMVLSMFVFAFITMFRQHHRDKNSPRLTVDAIVIGKRIDVSTYHHSDARSTTDYYITFQVESGDRFELMVADDIYGLIIEGDSGKLTFQGSQMLSFDRT